MKREGQITVHSENIFPVIKKWLYSDKDIFLRELISNATDAIQKLKRIESMGDCDLKDEKMKIEVVVDKEKKQLKIIDNGIGMTEDEVEKYITQIAFSGAEEFIEKYKDKSSGDAGIIGHFGLGFYSAFMVSDSVEIETLSYKDGARSVHWTSDGSYTYSIEDGSRTVRGTTIILNVSEESKDFLEEHRIREMLSKYCKFMPYEIYLNPKHDDSDKAVNNTNPLWKKLPKDCTKEEYESFYHEVFFDMNPPLFWIHLNVDYPFNLKGILYFPKQSDALKVMPGEIKLYSNQVYIADNIKEVVPEFLMLLKGVIDCPDMPLNVSRSFLQNDGELLKISRHITKKVSDKLNSIFEKDRAQYEIYWNDIAPFVKFGCIKDEKFYDKMKNVILFKDINGKYNTLDEYKKGDGNKVFYVNDENVQTQYIRMFKELGLNAMVLNHAIDAHFISFLEYKEQGNLKFMRIDSDISEELKSADDGKQIDKSEVKKIIDIFKKHVNVEGLEVEVGSLKSTKTPGVLLESEMERRMADMEKLYGQSPIMGMQLPKSRFKLILNAKNISVQQLPKLKDEDAKFVCEYIYDLAMLAQKPLSSDEMSSFIDRSVQLLAKKFSE